MLAQLNGTSHTAEHSPDSMWKGLSLLLEAYEYTLVLRRPLWDFAVELACLQAVGLTHSQLRWLVCQGYLEHALEKTRPRTRERTFQRVLSLMLRPESCFVLTTPGMELARSMACPIGGNGASVGTKKELHNDIPRWRADSQELWFGPYRVKKFRRPAPNQIDIFVAFEKAGWAFRIHNPLRSDLDGDGRERLHDAIKRLNQHQEHRCLCFHGDGSGDGVTWEGISSSAPDRPRIGP